MKEIFNRRSVRQFLNKEVEQEKVDILLRAAMQAPTAGNQMAWEFYVVKNKDILNKLAKTSPYAGCVVNAPMAIVITYKDGGLFPDYNDIDCAIATENIWLEACELGLGTVMLGIAPLQERMEAVAKVLDLSDDEHAFTILPIGYPVEVKEQQDRYNVKKIHYVE